MLVFCKARKMLEPLADWPCLLPTTQVNLVAGQCEHEGCNIISWYGYQGHKRRFCNKHKLPGMVRSQCLLMLHSSMRIQRQH